MQKIEGKQIYLRPITMEDTDRIVSRLKGMGEVEEK